MMGSHHQPGFSAAAGPVLACCRAAADPGGSREAPASSSETVGERYIFFNVLWWLLLPLAQDFLASV